MARSRILIGCISIPVIAAGLAAWLSMGDVEAVGQPSQTDACDPEKTGCPPGACCGDIIGTVDGCAPQDCCGDPSDVYCDASMAAIPEQWLKLRLDGTGVCIYAEGNPEVKCTYMDCDGPTFCSAGGCTMGEVAYEFKAAPIVTGAVCPPQQN